MVALLSGGIDSPVAAYRVMKRGCPVTFVHFHAHPFLEKTSQEKADALAAHLTRFQYASRLYLVPFGEIQREVVLSVPPPYGLNFRASSGIVAVVRCGSARAVAGCRVALWIRRKGRRLREEGHHAEDGA